MRTNSTAVNNELNAIVDKSKETTRKAVKQASENRYVYLVLALATGLAIMANLLGWIPENM